jgi:hypothetical protein
MPEENRKTLEKPVLLSGMGRSGTTWLSAILNHDERFNVLFEPFLPQKVPEATSLKYLQYINPRSSRNDLLSIVSPLLQGHVKNPWINKETTFAPDKPCLVKEIRSNLMLAWLQRNIPELSIVLLVRHPVAIAKSWERLDWRNEAFSTRPNLDAFMTQPELLDDFPEIKEVYQDVRARDLFSQVVFQWCIYHAVPLRQLRKGEAHVLFYENLLLNPRDELEVLFKFLGMELEWDQVEKIFYEPSSTNFLKRRFDRGDVGGKKQLDFISRLGIDRKSDIDWILSRFGLSTLYNKEGIPTTQRGSGELLARL